MSLENYNNRELKNELQRRQHLFIESLVNAFLQDPELTESDKEYFKKITPVYFEELQFKNGCISNGIISALEVYLQK